MKEVLRELALSPDSALELGKAAEHLVAADLILQGYRCYLSDQGLPYDLVVDLAGRLLRIQVKAACFPKNVNAQGRNARLAYNWSVRRRGKNGSKRLGDDDCDLVALAALDIRQIAYFPIRKCATTMQLNVEGTPIYVGVKRTKFGKYPAISSYTFGSALADYGGLSGSIERWEQGRSPEKAEERLLRDAARSHDSAPLLRIITNKAD